MVKKVLFIISVLTATCIPSFAVSDNLTQSQVREAREFGRANKADIENILLHLYSISGAGPCSHEIVIRTKWCKIALLEGIKAQQGKDATPQEQSMILQDQDLQIDLTVYGTSLDFARGYTVTALQEEIRIEPEILHADHFQAPVQMEKTLHGFPSYYATIRIYFKYTSLQMDKHLKLELRKGKGVSIFDIDLAKFQ